MECEGFNVEGLIKSFFRKGSNPRSRPSLSDFTGNFNVEQTLSTLTQPIIST
jgi:hypothetical protein